MEGYMYIYYNPFFYIYYAKGWPTLYSGPPGKLPVLQMASPPLAPTLTKLTYLWFSNDLEDSD